MILFYESSEGEVFDLKAKRGLRTRTASYHVYEWLPQAVTQQYGEKVYRFDKDAAVFSTLITVFGSLEERRRRLNQLHAAFNKDIYNMRPGKIKHGDYYIECYVTVSNTYPENPFTQNELSIYCPYPFWLRDTEIHYKSIEAPAYPYLDYNYGYEYDFAAKLPGYGVIDNLGERDADYTLTIYGGTTAPEVVINDLLVGANISLGQSEKLIIDTKAKTVTKIGKVTENCFNQRFKSERSIFEKLPPGPVKVAWSGAFEFDLVIHEERSEPLWI